MSVASASVAAGSTAGAPILALATAPGIIQIV
jgi:hypothetical protein